MRTQKLPSADAVPVVVKLDYDSLAAYTGDIEGLAATSPSVTGEPIDPDSAASQEYLDYAEGVESTFVHALDAAIPSAEVGESLQVLYGGVAVQVPGNQISELAKLPGVAAVQANELRQPLNELRGLRGFDPRSAVRRTLLDDDPPPPPVDAGTVKPNGQSPSQPAGSEPVRPLAAGERPPIDPDAT